MEIEMNTTYLKCSKNEAIRVLLDVDSSGQLGSGICGERDGVVALYADTDFVLPAYATDWVCSEEDFLAAPSKRVFTVYDKRNETRNGVRGTRFIMRCENTGKFHDAWIAASDATEFQCRAAFTSACMAKIAY